MATSTPIWRKRCTASLLSGQTKVIAGVPLDYSTVGVDRPEDVPVVERLLESDPVQRALLARTTR